VDSVKLTGPEIADIMNNLRVGFENGNLEALAVTTLLLGRGVEAYDAVAEGSKRTKQILVPGVASERQ
jgi:hypothetical protein